MTASPVGYGELQEVFADVASKNSIQNKPIQHKSAKLNQAENAVSGGEKLTVPAHSLIAKQNGTIKKNAAQQASDSSQQIIIDYASANGGSLSYIADGTLTPETVQVIPIEVACMDDTSKKGNVSVVIINEQIGCTTVILSANQMNAGDTITVSIEKKLEDGVTLVPYPAGTLFTLNLIDGKAYGTLVGSGGSGPTITTTSPAQFIAKSKIHVESAVVTIRATVNTGNAGAAKKNSVAEPAGPQCSNPPEASVEVDGNALDVDYPKEDQFITGDDLPRMPDLLSKIKARLHYKKTIPVNYKWQITIKWVSDINGWTTPHNNEVYLGQVDNAETNQWTDLNVNLNTYTRGGQTVTLHVEAYTTENTGERDYAKTFVIKGTNPEEGTVLSEFNNHLYTNYTIDNYSAVAWQESRFNQFAPSVTSAIAHPHSKIHAFPLQGGDFYDFGIMGVRLAGKIDWDYSLDDLAWSWVANVQQGQSYFNQQIGNAINYQNRGYFKKYQPIPDALMNSPSST